MKFGSISAILIICIWKTVFGDQYPQGSLECHSTQTKPTQKNICPHARNQWCVKEISSLPLALCGKTQYYADEFVNGMCEYKKCDNVCVPGKFTFIWDSLQYTRTRFCCNNGNLCNSAFSFGPSKLSMTVLLGFISILCFLL